MTTFVTRLQLFMCFVIFTGCASHSVKGVDSAAPSSFIDAQDAELFVHEVLHHGETLSHIANWYTGAAQWKEIAEATPGLEPHNLKIGQIILIPQQLVVREDPLPKPKLPSSTTTQQSNAHELLKTRQVCREYQEKFRGDEERLKLLDEVLECSNSMQLFPHTDS